MKPDFFQYGFRYQDNLIHAFIGGSQMHGAKLQDSDDTDWYGVYIEPAYKFLGLDSDEHFVFTTGGERGGNRPGDTDVCLYSLRKWARLAVKGNPSVLHFLFAKEEFCTIWWAIVMQNRDLFMARSHVGQFFGYANAQLQRLLNQRGQKNCHRPFLEEQHGFDTKYAMHIIRLLGEAKEFLATGKITLPRSNRDELIEIRKGKFKLHEITEWADTLQREALTAKETSPLPEKIDRKAVSQLLTRVYLDFWQAAH